LVHLNAPGWNVIGAQEAPFVGIALGHNERVAWSMTASSADNQDLYVEKLNPANPRQVLLDRDGEPKGAVLGRDVVVLASGNLGAIRYDRRSFLYFAGGGAFENTGVFLLIFALGLGEVSVVVPLAGTSPLFVLLLAYCFPSGIDRLNWRLVTGAVLIVLGVFLLTGWGIGHLA
jgi:uncharacterized membrane protein